MKDSLSAIDLKSVRATTVLFLMIYIVAGMPYVNSALAAELDQSAVSECPEVTTAFGCGGNEVWGVNLFTPTQDGYLDAVGTHFIQNNSSYEMRIYDKFSEGSFSSQLGASVSGSVTDAGYYTIPLPGRIRLQAGDSVAIVVKFTTPGYYYPLPMAASAAIAGQSYYSCNGSYFMDTKTYLDPDSKVGIYGVILQDTDGDGIADIEDPCPTAKPARIMESSLSFGSLQDALAEPGLVSGNVIGCHGVQFEGPMVYEQNKAVTLRGGYNCEYSSNSTSTYTGISGSLTVKSGKLIAENITIH